MGKTTIKKDGEWYVTTDFSTGVASQGKTKEEAKRNLQEALELYNRDEEEKNKTLKASIQKKWSQGLKKGISTEEQIEALTSDEILYLYVHRDIIGEIVEKHVEWLVEYYIENYAKAQEELILELMADGEITADVGEKYLKKLRKES